MDVRQFDDARSQSILNPIHRQISHMMRWGTESFRATYWDDWMYRVNLCYLDWANIGQPRPTKANQGFAPQRSTKNGQCKRGSDLSTFCYEVCP